MDRAVLRGWVPLATLLAAFALQSVGSMRQLSATSDETTHLPSGYTYLRTGDLRLNPQHPPLIKELCASPLLLLEPRLDLRHPSWQPETLDEWRLGYDFLYSNDAGRLLFWGRLPVVLLAVILGLYVHRWARERFGATAAGLALLLYCFCPNVLAHSHLVTMDLGLACFSTATLYHLWRFSGTGGWRHAIAAGLALGLALATKFAAVILVPVTCVLLVLGALRPGEDAVRARAVRLALAFGILVLLAVVVIHAAYLFPSDPRLYWKGMLRVNADHRPDYASYLMGSFRIGGWWYYFLVAFLVKTPIPALAAVAASLFLSRRHRAGSWIDEAFLALPIVAFTAFTSALADNLGIRYLLPVYPLLFILAGRVGIEVARHRGWACAAVALGIWYVGGTAFIYPNHLAYFNEAAGGPGRGHLWLDDSNIDWGEGLPQLKAYLDREGVDVVRLHYGGNGSPAYYGIRFEPVRNEDWASPRPPPGIYAVSTHLLVRGEYHARTLGVPTNWLTLYRPVARVGYSFYVFRFDAAPASASRPPEPVKARTREAPRSASGPSGRACG